MAVKTITSIQRYIGLSTDTKPTSVRVGSEFWERDTGDKYICYDGTLWALKIEALGGG